MSITPNMNLTVPGVGTTSAPDYATQINNNFNTLDSHNHTPGSGAPIPISALDVNSDLSFKDAYSPSSVLSVKFTNNGSPLTTLNSAFVVNGNLYFKDGSGTNIPITAGGVVNATSTGLSLGTYIAAFNVSGVLEVRNSGSSPANIRQPIDVREVILRGGTSPTYGLTLQPPTLTSDFSLTLPVQPTSYSPAGSGANVMTLNSSGTMSSVTFNDVGTTMGATGAQAIAITMGSTGADTIGAAMTSTGANAIAATMTSTGTTSIAGTITTANAVTIVDKIDSTLSQTAADTIGQRMTSTGANAISDDVTKSVVTTPGTAVRQVVRSALCGGQTTGYTFTLVPNSGLKILTTGRPVALVLQGEPAGVTDQLGGVLHCGTASGEVGGCYAIAEYTDGTYTTLLYKHGQYNLFNSFTASGATSKDIRVPSSALSCITMQGNSTTTRYFAVVFKCLGTGAITTLVSNAYLVAYEI